MSVMDSVSRQSAKAWHELLAFDWRRLRHPSAIGSWPALPRQSLLLFCALSVSGLVFTVSVMFMPAVSAEDYALMAALEHKVRIQQAENLHASTQQLELQRQSSISSALLQHDPSEKADITTTMDVVRAAAHISGVQLHVVVPQISPGNEQMIFQLSARTTLLVLSAFWLELLSTGYSFSVNALALQLTEKQDIFELNMTLSVPAAFEIRQPSYQYEARHFTESDEQEVSDLCRTELCAAQAKPSKKESEGFLLRSGSSKILYLVRDEKGHLRGVEQ
jgi:hypothetical protein